MMRFMGETLSEAEIQVIINMPDSLAKMMIYVDDH